MNESNRLELASKLHELGFPRSLNTQVERMINTGKDEFSLVHTHEFKSPPNGRKLMLCELLFEEVNGNYRLEGYKAETWHRDEPYQRIYGFKIGTGKSTTLSEAANLLDGRAVKGCFMTYDLKEHPIWECINWDYRAGKSYHGMFKYSAQPDLSAQLKKFPFLERDDAATHQERINGLERGDAVKVDVGRGHSFYLTFDPQEEKIIVRNTAGITLNTRIIDKLLQRINPVNPRLTSRNFKGFRI